MCSTAENIEPYKMPKWCNRIEMRSITNSLFAALAEPGTQIRLFCVSLFIDGARTANIRMHKIVKYEGEKKNVHPESVGHSRIVEPLLVRRRPIVFYFVR